jgi:hypothetical protein
VRLDVAHEGSEHLLDDLDDLRQLFALDEGFFIDVDVLLVDVILLEVLEDLAYLGIPL